MIRAEATHQHGLADPRLAPDEHEPPAPGVGDVGEVPVQGVDRLGALQQAGRSRHGRCRRRDGRPPGHLASARSARDRDDVNRLRQSLELDRAAVDVGDSVHLPREMCHRLARQELACGSQAAQPSCQVECPTAIAVADRHRLARVHPDPDRQGEVGVRGTLLVATGEEVDARRDRLPRRIEDGEGLVAAQLDHGTAAALHLLLDEVGETADQPSRRFVPVLVGEPGVAPDVGDQERLDAVAAGVVGVRHVLSIARSGEKIFRLRAQLATGP